MASKGIAQLLKECNNLETDEERIEFLRQHRNSVLEIIFGYRWHPRVKFLLPQGMPEDFQYSTEDVYHSQLYADANAKLRAFSNHPDYANIPPHKRETIFLEWVRYLPEDDAKLIVALKDGMLPYENITKEVVSAAYPDLAKNW